MTGRLSVSPMPRSKIPKTSGTTLSSIRRLAWMLALAACGAAPATAQVAPAQKAPWLVGMSAPLTGPRATLGLELSQGVRLGLEHANRRGGVDGHRIELELLDDADNPQSTASNTRKFVDDGVIALTGYAGGAGTEGILALLASSQTPLIGAATGADRIQHPSEGLVFNLRAGAGDELAGIVAQLDSQGIVKVGLIAEAGSLGDAALESTRVELARIGIRPVGVYKTAPSAVDVAKGMVAMCATEPEAIVLAIDSRFVMAAIQGRPEDCRARFVLLSETAASLMGSGGREALKGIIVSQVVPSPANISHPLSAAFQEDAATSPGMTRSYPALEGYVYGRAVAEAAMRCSKNMSRHCMVDTLQARGIDLPGWKVRYGGNELGRPRFVELSIVGRDGRYLR